MKRLLRTYLSAALLLCFLIQLAPLSLLHSHEDHLSEVEHSISPLHEAQSNDGDYIDDAHHESSTEECGICKVQQTLNNQAYTLVKQVNVFNFTLSSTILFDIEESLDDHLIKSNSGRAPPIV